MALMRRVMVSNMASSNTIKLLSLSSNVASMHRYYPTLLFRQMSTEAENVAARLKSLGMIRSQGLIGGKWTDAYDGKVIEVTNPATGDVLANVSCMGARETNDAISAAYEAFNKWSKTTAAERSKCLRKWYDLLIAHKEELGQLMTLEQGKPLKEAIGEVSYGASFIEFFSEEAKRVYGEIIPASLSDRRLFVLKQGAKILLGGRRHSLGMTFYEPTVMTDIKSDMLLSREEIFGPVAPLHPFKTEEEAIHLANDTNAGLAAYIFTKNIQRSWRVSEALEYGIVGVNEGLVSTEVAPFGGFKQSGIGREGSKYGMAEYLEIKYVCMGDMNN